MPRLYLPQPLLTSRRPAEERSLPSVLWVFPGASAQRDMPGTRASVTELLPISLIVSRHPMYNRWVLKQRSTTKYTAFLSDSALSSPQWTSYCIIADAAPIWQLISWSSAWGRSTPTAQKGQTTFLRFRTMDSDLAVLTPIPAKYVLSSKGHGAAVFY